jgi:membrane protein
MSDYTARWERAKETAQRRTQRGRSLVNLFYSRPVGRAVRRYIESNGNVLAGGVAYYSLASIAAGIVLAVTVASAVVIGNDVYREAVFEFIGNAIPGLFPSEDGQAGIVDPDTLQPTPMSGFVGLVAFLVLVYTATRYMRGMRAAMRSMLGSASGKYIPGTLSDIIALVGLAIVAIVAVTLQLITGALAGFVADLLGDDSVSVVSVRIIAAVAGIAANVAFVAIIFLVLGSARAPARYLVPTIVVTAVVVAILQAASGLFVQSASNNQVLAPFAAVIALLLFVDLSSRAILIAGAWIGAAVGAPAGEYSHVLPSPARRSGKSVTTRRATGRAPDSP